MQLGRLFSEKKKKRSVYWYNTWCSDKEIDPSLDKCWDAEIIQTAHADLGTSRNSDYTRSQTWNE